MFNRFCPAHKVAAVLVLVGAINWGLIGLFHFNLVYAIFGSWSMVERVIYTLVGLSGVFMLFSGTCKQCHFKEMGGKK